MTRERLLARVGLKQRPIAGELVMGSDVRSTIAAEGEGRRAEVFGRKVMRVQLDPRRDVGLGSGAIGEAGGGSPGRNVVDDGLLTLIFERGLIGHTGPFEVPIFPIILRFGW